MAKRHFITKVHASRSSYFFLYLMAFLIISALAYLTLNNYEISSVQFIVAIVFVIFIIKIIEIHRRRDWWGLTDSNLYESKSILNKNIREVDFASISSLEVDQPLFKRFLNYGTITVRMRLYGPPIVIKNIKNPEGFLKMAQKLIFEKKGQKNDE